MKTKEELMNDFFDPKNCPEEGWDLKQTFETAFEIGRAFEQARHIEGWQTMNKLDLDELEERN